MKLSEILLDIISEIGRLAPRPFETPSAHIRRIRGYGRYSSASIGTTLRRLEKRGLIERKILNNNRWQYTITPTGKLYRGRKLNLKKRTDGMATMVIFDIPEDKRNSRNTFRRFMLKNGFNYLQESVLVGAYEFHNECRSIAKELDIDKFITVCSVKIESKKLTY